MRFTHTKYNKKYVHVLVSEVSWTRTIVDTDMDDEKRTFEVLTLDVGEILMKKSSCSSTRTSAQMITILKQFVHSHF